MTIANDKHRASLREKYMEKPLRELEKQRVSSMRGIEDARREIALLDAMIAGLSDQRPEGFGAKVEELREQQARHQATIDNASLMLEVLAEVIAEKEGEM